MATLIPEIKFSEFKLLKASQLQKLKSCEVTSNGEYLFTFLNAQTAYIKNQAEFNAQLSNSIKGLDLEQAKKEA